MKISDSSIMLRSSAFDFDAGQGLAGLGSGQPQTGTAYSPPAPSARFATLFQETLHLAANRTTEQTTQSIEVSSRSEISRKSLPPRRLTQTKFSRFVLSSESAPTGTSQWRTPFFGMETSATRNASLALHFFSANGGQLDIDFLLRIYRGTESYSNIFLAFLLFHEEAQAVPQGEQQTAGSSSARQSFLLSLLPHTQIDFAYQQMDFNAYGAVCTDDGREISLDFNLNMTRSVVRNSSSSLSARLYQLLDPLVLDLEGNGVGLSAEQFSFDLDGDGAEDSMSCLGPGCGFLAYDQNQDGFINDGLELFGTISGDGFADLAQYDLDGNNWIDENDEIFDALSIWKKGADGDMLMSLTESGVGAIYLDHVETPFALHDGANSVVGEVAGSGIYLKESGEVQAIHHIDLATHSETGKVNTTDASSEDVDSAAPEEAGCASEPVTYPGDQAESPTQESKTSADSQEPAPTIAA